jgi:hypothetical protein
MFIDGVWILGKRKAGFHRSIAVDTVVIIEPGAGLWIIGGYSKSLHLQAETARLQQGAYGCQMAW